MAFLLCVGFRDYGVMRKFSSRVGCPLSGRYTNGVQMQFSDLKEVYFNELNLIYNFNEKLTFPVSLLAILGGVLVTIAKVYTSEPEPDLLFSISVFMSVIFFIFSCAFICWSILSRFEYRIAPKYTELFNYNKEIEHYEEEIASYNKVDSLNVSKGESYEDYLNRIFSECIDHNSSVNLKRTVWLSRSLLCSVICAVFLAASSIGYFKVLSEQSSKTINVRVVEESKIIAPWR